MALPPPPPGPPPSDPPPPPSGEPYEPPQQGGVSLLGGPDIQNTYDHEANRWGLGQFVLVIALWQLLGWLVIVALTDATIGSFRSSTAIGSGALLVVLATGPIVAIIYIVGVSYFRGSGLSPDFQVRFEPIDIAIGTLLMIGGIVAAGLVDAVFRLNQSEAAAVDLARDHLTGGDGGVTISLLLFALMGATLIPVAEELVFRGLFWSALEKRGVSNRVTLGITSFLFAAWHLEPRRFVALLVISLALGYGRLKTGRIGPCLVVHVMVNTIGMLALVGEVAS